MKVLHYIEKKDEKFGADAKFVQMLCEQMSPVITSIIVTGRPSRRSFLKVLYANNPDIVHIHACWSYKASEIESWSLSRGYTVVLSTHGGLMPNVLQTEFWKQKVPRLLFYQWSMVRHCSLLLASSAKELKELKSLGWRKRIALVRSPFVSNDVKISPQASAQDMKAVYQKLIDTRKRLNINAFEEQMLTFMLHASLMDREGFSIEDSHELTTALERNSEFRIQNSELSLSAMEWNELLLCAKDRGILDEVLNGARLLGMTPAMTEITEPPRFIPKFSLKIRVDDSAAQKLDRNFPDIENYEKSFVLRVYKLRNRILKYRCDSDKYSVWNELNSIFTFLRTKDYDEPQIILAVKKLDIEDFFGRIEQILSETHLLTKGFMPTEPIKDKMTDFIRKQIYLKP